MDGKTWYKSKTVWTAIITGLIGVLHASGIEVPSWSIEVLIGLGLYGIRDAVGKNAKLGK